MGFYFVLFSVSLEKEKERKGVRYFFKPSQDIPVGDIVEKKSRGRKKSFYACTRYPDCNFLVNKKPESEEELQAALEHWKKNPPKPRKEYKKKKF